ncbi:hypothetical protein PR048_008917 [Dryococelus australis]|uniref:DUF5641 domain-containing protein n=1 Tax=Dryococelus australis TaxID=614101 RepID=A0ABQ9I098_9NEOP|nr:hypothetical protein PR048_008917 [Dryococelus australis]
MLQAYICLLCVLQQRTKAIHLELVSDLSTQSLDTDNVPTFTLTVALTWSQPQLEEVQTFLADSDTLLQIVDSLAEHKITWHFNPPAATHFCGLWEVGIKSGKSIHKKVVGTQLLTYEELSTVLAQIETTLNSKPLCPQSSDPYDFSVLTPLLRIGPAQILPELDMSTPVNRLTRWSLLHQIHQSFWKQWHVEYLHHLQPKVKWTSGEYNIAEGSLVLVKDLNLPPLQWKFDRPWGRLLCALLRFVPSKASSPGQLLSCVLFLLTSARLNSLLAACLSQVGMKLRERTAQRPQARIRRSGNIVAVSCPTLDEGVRRKLRHHANTNNPSQSKDRLREGGLAVIAAAITVKRSDQPRSANNVRCYRMFVRPMRIELTHANIQPCACALYGRFRAIHDRPKLRGKSSVAE